MGSLPDTLLRALDAYGGEAFWRAARSIRATVSTSGLAFVLKWQKPFRRIGVECGVREPFTRLTPMDEAGNSGVLRQGDVFLENPSGSVIAHRRNATILFPLRQAPFLVGQPGSDLFRGIRPLELPGLSGPSAAGGHPLGGDRPEPSPGSLSRKHPDTQPRAGIPLRSRLGAPSAAQLHGRGHGRMGEGGKCGHRSRHLERHPLPVAPASDPAKKRRVPRRRTRPHRSHHPRLVRILLNSPSCIEGCSMCARRCTGGRG